MTDEQSDLYKYFDSWLKTREVDARLLHGGAGSILAFREETITGTVVYLAEQRDEFESLLNQLQSDS